MELSLHPKDSQDLKAFLLDRKILLKVLELLKALEFQPGTMLADF